MPKRERQGTVLSDKMDKTIVVQVAENRRHSKYGKFMRHFVKFKAHDANNECQIGDTVRIVECRRHSKTKSWALKDILQRGQVTELPPDNPIE